MTDQAEIADVKAAAIVSFTLSRTLLGILQHKGILSPEEADLLVEGMLTTVESVLSPTDPATKPARELLQTVADETRAAGQLLRK